MSRIGEIGSPTRMQEGKNRALSRLIWADRIVNRLTYPELAQKYGISATSVRRRCVDAAKFRGGSMDLAQICLDMIKAIHDEEASPSREEYAVEVLHHREQGHTYEKTARHFGISTKHAWDLVQQAKVEE